MSVDRPVLGVFLMLGFCVMAPLGDALAKLLGQQIGVGQLVAIRMGLQVLLLLPIVWWTRLTLRMSARVLRLTAVRAVLHVLGIGVMFTSLLYLPLGGAGEIGMNMSLYGYDGHWLMVDMGIAFGDDTTWQFGAEFQAMESLKLRATAGTVFRAPTITDHSFISQGIRATSPPRATVTSSRANFDTR